MKLFGMRDSLIRRAVLRTFRVINPGDISVRHHWVGKPLQLHSFQHKGYWWHGKRREHETIMRFKELIRPGDTVLEIGAHIGYMAMLFCDLVGPKGVVKVFEPGENNLPYLRKNLLAYTNVEIVTKCASDSNGTVNFYLENLSGQNNSLLEDYYLLDGNIRLAGVKDIVRRKVTVDAVKLDDYVVDSGIGKVAFVKIDVEGAELVVLRGAKEFVLSQRPIMMVEVTREAEAIIKWFSNIDYRMYDPLRNEITKVEKAEGNIFFVPIERSELMSR
jgi:FkbM family methyltransferase